MLRMTSAVASLFALSLLAGCGGGGSSSGSAQLTLSPSASLTFADTIVGQTSASQVLTLTNSGTATLTLSVGTVTGATADFTSTTTCGTSLAASVSCTFTITFAPQSTGTLTATITLTDNASNSPQTITLTGNGTPVLVPQAALAPTGLIFPITSINSTSLSQTVTLTNTGNGALSIASIAIGGTNASDFAETNTCPSALAAGSPCTISVTFTPAAATSYTAILTVTDNSGNTSGATQSVNLSGTGTSVVRTLYVFPESDNSVTPLYTLINNAQSSIDITMYELQDTVFTGDLVAACNRGVTVRVLLDASLEMTNNTPAYNQLNTSGPNCSAVFSNTAFQATHQKTITVDSATKAMTTAIMTLNLQSQDYSTSRDFALVENDSADIAAIETTFEADYQAGTPYEGTQGPSDFDTITPGAGDDLIWSPTTAQQDMLGIITSATKTLLIENEELSAGNIVSALETACKNGVTVHIAMSEDSTEPPYSSYSSNWIALEEAGCGVHVYLDTATGLYIHAKAVVADYGLSTQNAYMGSINYSIDSMTENRELGLYITDSTAVTQLNTTMSADYAGGIVFTGGIVD